jgi:hypothetical protein
VSGTLVLSLLLAAVSALALNWGLFRQHEQASALPPLSLRRPLRSLLLLFSSWRWLVGFVVGIGGWALYVGALAFGPLSLVQATSAGGIGVLALLVWRRGGILLVRHESLGVSLSVAGLVLLGISLLGRSGNTRHWHGHGSWVVVAVWMVVSAACAAVAAGPARRAFA